MYFLLTSHLWCKSWWSHGLWYYVSMAIVVQTPLYLHRSFFDSPTLADHSTPQLVFFLATPASHLLKEKFLIQTDLKFIGFYLVNIKNRRKTSCSQVVFTKFPQRITELKLIVSFAMCVRPECARKINVVKCSLLVKESYLLKKNTTYLKYAYYA